MKQENREQIFKDFMKIVWACQNHDGQIANLFITKEEDEHRGLVCVLCLPNQMTKDDHQARSLKMVFLQIHQSYQTLIKDVVTTAFVDHHIVLIRGMIRNQFKQIEGGLNQSVTTYFQKYRDLLNGKYFNDFYVSMNEIIRLKALKNSPGERQLQKWKNKLFSFIYRFYSLVNEDEEYTASMLEDRLFGKNLIHYIRTQIKEIYKEFKQKSQGLKKNYHQEEILSIFNPTQSINKSFRFSSSLLHSDLKFTDPKTIKMPNIPDNQYTLLSLIQPAIGCKKRSIKLRMDGIKGWVAVGIAFKSQVEASSYKFQQSSHGTIQISYDGYSWSNDSSVNEQYTSWYFNEGDNITMTINPASNQLSFQRGQQSNVHTLKYNKQKKEKIYFCVSLNYHGDAVTIIQ